MFLWMSTPTFHLWLNAVEALWMVDIGLGRELVQKLRGGQNRAVLTSQLQACLNAHPNILRWFSIKFLVELVQHSIEECEISLFL